MNGKERIDAIINNQPVDRTPFAVLDAGAWVANEAGLTFRELIELEDAGASYVVKYFDQIDADMISAFSAFAVAFLDAVGCKADIDIKGSTIDVHKCIQDLEEEIPKLDKSKVREMFESSWIFLRLLHQTREIKKLVGDTKYINVCLAAPFTTAGIMVGAQELMMMLVDEDSEELVAQLLDYATEVSVVAYEMVQEAGADIAWFGEPISSGAMLGQPMFEEYAIDCIQDGHDRLKDKYKYMFMHMCGNSGARVASVKNMGFKAFSVDAPVDLEQAAKDCDGRMVMIGNIGPSSPLMSGNVQDITAAAQEAVEKTAKGGGRLILCPGCDVPVGTSFQNLNAILSVAKAN